MRGGSEVATDYRYTGQRWQGALGLYYYRARWYDPQMRRFIQADTIVPEPGNPQTLNRYAYALNNPVKYNDPNGHWVETALDIAGIAYDIYEIKRDGLTWVNGIALGVDVACLLLPVAAGGGAAVRAIAHADDVVDAAKAVDKATDVARAVDALDDAGDALSMARRLSETGANADDAIDIARHLSDASTHGDRISGGITVLGSHPEYVNIGRYEGLTYFDMPGDVWNALKGSDDAVWAVNRQFLDDSIEAGHKFVVTVGDHRVMSECTGLMREIDYLENHGYRLIEGIYVKVVQ